MGDLNWKIKQKFSQIYMKILFYLVILFYLAIGIICFFFWFLMLKKSDRIEESKYWFFDFIFHIWLAGMWCACIFNVLLLLKIIK
jgi:hypothetical protein